MSVGNEVSVDVASNKVLMRQDSVHEVHIGRHADNACIAYKKEKH